MRNGQSRTLCDFMASFQCNNQFFYFLLIKGYKMRFALRQITWKKIYLSISEGNQKYLIYNSWNGTKKNDLIRFNYNNVQLGELKSKKPVLSQQSTVFGNIFLPSDRCL